MPDEALQTAFEIKTTCDEISRKLLRWHWENKPGEHSLGALLDHIRTRQQESPEYYDRLPDLAGRNSWQQLDTTLCMRGTRLLPAGPATRCALPAMKRPMLLTARQLRRRQSSSTRPWKHWKRAMQARPCAPVSWASITGWLRII